MPGERRRRRRKLGTNERHNEKLGGRTNDIYACLPRRQQQQLALRLSAAIARAPSLARPPIRSCAGGQCCLLKKSSSLNEGKERGGAELTPTSLVVVLHAGGRRQTIDPYRAEMLVRSIAAPELRLCNGGRCSRRMDRGLSPLNLYSAGRQPPMEKQHVADRPTDRPTNLRTDSLLLRSIAVGSNGNIATMRQRRRRRRRRQRQQPTLLIT